MNPMVVHFYGTRRENYISNMVRSGGMWHQFMHAFLRRDEEIWSDSESNIVIGIKNRKRKNKCPGVSRAHVVLV